MDFAMESTGGYVSSSSSSMTYGQAMGGGDIIGSLRNFLEHSIADMFVDEAPAAASRRSASAPRSRMPSSAASTIVTGTADKKSLTPRDHGGSQQCPGSQRRPQRGRLVQDAGPQVKDSHGGLLDVMVSGFSSIGQRATVLLNTLDANIDSMFHPDKHINDEPSSSDGEQQSTHPSQPPLPRRLSDDIYLHGPPGAGRSGTAGSRRDQSPLPLAAAAAGPAGRLVVAGGKSKRGSPKKKLILVRRSPTTVAADQQQQKQPGSSAAGDETAAAEAGAPSALASAAAASGTARTAQVRATSVSPDQAAAPALCAASTVPPAATAIASPANGRPAMAMDSRKGPASLSPTSESPVADAASSSPASPAASTTVPSLASMDAPALRREVLRLRKDNQRLKAELLASEGRCGSLEDEANRLRGADHHLDPAVSDAVASQLQALLADKARLVQRNAMWAAEAASLHELLAFATQPTCVEEDISDDIDSVFEADMSTAGNTPATVVGWEFVGRRRGVVAGSASCGATSCSARRAVVQRGGHEECDMASISALNGYYSRLLYTSGTAQGVAVAAATEVPPRCCGANEEEAQCCAAPGASQSAAGKDHDLSDSQQELGRDAGRGRLGAPASPVGEFESKLDAVRTAQPGEAAAAPGMAPDSVSEQSGQAGHEPPDVGEDAEFAVVTPATWATHDDFFQELAVHDYVES